MLWRKAKKEEWNNMNEVWVPVAIAVAVIGALGLSAESRKPGPHMAQAGPPAAGPREPSAAEQRRQPPKEAEERDDDDDDRGEADNDDRDD
jgi:hypothetical protein